MTPNIEDVAAPLAGQQATIESTMRTVSGFIAAVQEVMNYRLVQIYENVVFRFITRMRIKSATIQGIPEEKRAEAEENMTCIIRTCREWQAAHMETKDTERYLADLEFFANGLLEIEPTLKFHLYN